MSNESFNSVSGEKDAPLRLIYAAVVQASAAQQFRRPNWRYWTFEYVLEGEGFLKTGGHSYAISRSDAYFLQEGKSYHYGAGRKNPWKKIFFVLDGWLVGQLWQAYGLERCHFVADCRLLDYFRKILELKSENRPDMNQRAALVFHEMLTGIYTGRPGSASVYPRAVQQAMNFIRANLEQAVSMGDIADATSASPSHLTRIFKAETGMTPYAYLLDQRMSLARRLLKGTTMPIKEIAARLQYADAYYFSNAFKKRHAVSPTIWRRSELPDH